MTANSREGITYSSEWLTSFQFQWVSEDQLMYKRIINYTNPALGDGRIIPVDIPQNETPFFFQFYGGPGSAQYKKVYISTNGFISFDNNTQSGPSPPPSVPFCDYPNAFIAGVWCDLQVDTGTSIITGLYGWLNQWRFVIIYKNVLHKASEQRLTFEIMLENAPQYSGFCAQSKKPSSSDSSQITIS
jgi:hypothetical protein